MIHYTHLLSCGVTRFIKRNPTQTLLLFILAMGFNLGTAQAAMIDAIDIQQRGGETYVYVHTNEAIEHETHVENRHSISVILEDVSVFGGQLPIHYENAPSIKNVILEHIGPKQIKLSLDGKQLKTPIVGFRESSVVSVNQATRGRTPAVAASFLALAAENTQAAEAINPVRSAVLPTALESSIVNGGIQRPATQNDTYTQAVLLKVAEYYISLLKWAKEHRFVLTMVLLGGIGSLFILNFVSKLVFAKIERQNPFNIPTHAETQARNTLRMQGLSFQAPASSGVSHPTTPQPSVANEHRLNRIREKMKQQGYNVAAEATPVTAPIQHPSDMNLKVKEAIARRKSQQYQLAGGATAKPQTPQHSYQQATPGTPTAEPLAGNGFLHAMAEYMDTSSKEHIAKAIQQSKLKY
jgi:hypothetical protein